MNYPKTLEKVTTYSCGHTLHLTKTVSNDDEEECFVCWMYGMEPCPECRAVSGIRYREVYEAIENTRFNNSIILFKRRSPVGTGSMLFEENLWNDSDTNLRTTRLLVEHDINSGRLVPVGIYMGDHFLPFSGYAAGYMKFLRRHDLEAVQAENGLRESNRKATDDWGI
jgi:hypothetical protein